MTLPNLSFEPSIYNTRNYKLEPETRQALSA